MQSLTFYQTSIKQIEKEALKLNEKYGAPLNIIFEVLTKSYNFNGEIQTDIPKIDPSAKPSGLCHACPLGNVKSQGQNVINVITRLWIFLQFYFH